MAHRTFFSFRYERDVWRASVVRNSSRMKTEIDPEWIDASIWEEAKKSGDAVVQRFINNALKNTTVAAVLIGSQTASRRWINYEIDQSIARGNGLLGIYINNIKDKDGNTDWKGVNPLPSGHPTYDWVYDDGYTNLGTWADAAYNAAH